jgi:sterol desaturase/sphingolipid hydroxylase (fatty acid hydroxylase superfamily)
MLANAAGMLFFLRSAKEWSLTEFIGYSLVMYIAVEALNWGVFFAFENHTRKRIPAGGQALWVRGWKDYAFILFNKTATVVFSYHLAHHCFHSAMPKTVSELTLANTLLVFPFLFIVYDLPYSIFHRALHHNKIYAWVHKHHHREAAPVHGHDDAVNTHPFEFVVGEYLHLFAVAVLPCHMFAAIAFISLGGILASLSHTRFDIHVQLGPLVLYSVKEHDTHHKMLKGNYGQYTQVWDRVFSTFYHWVPVNLAPGSPSADGGGPNRAPLFPTPGLTADTAATAMPASAPAPAPASCAVFPAHTPLGLRTVATLASRGAVRILAVAPSAAAATVIAEARRSGALVVPSACTLTVLVADPAAAADASGAVYTALTTALKDAAVDSVFIIAQHQQAEAAAATGASAGTTATPARLLLTPSPVSASASASAHARSVRAAEGLLVAASTAGVRALAALTDAFAAAHCDGSYLAPDVRAATEASSELLMHASAGRGPSIGSAAGAQLMIECRVLSENLKPAAASALATAVVAAPRVYGAGFGDVALARDIVKASLLFGEHILSSGANVQSFTHADNAVDALLRAAARASRARAGAGAVNGDSGGAVLPQPTDKAENEDGLANASYDDESFTETLAALRRSDAYTIVADADAHYVWDVAERLRVSVGLSTIWDCFHIYNHLLYPLAYLGHCIEAVTGRVAPWPLHVTAGAVEAATRTLTFDVSKARKVLQWAPIAPAGLKALYTDATHAGQAALTV